MQSVPRKYFYSRFALFRVRSQMCIRDSGVVGAGEIADPEECAKITALGVDFLAAGRCV